MKTISLTDDDYQSLIHGIDILIHSYSQLAENEPLSLSERTLCALRSVGYMLVKNDIQAQWDR